MADRKTKEAVKKAAELDKELDEYIQSIEEKSKGYKYESGITEENWEQVREGDFRKETFFI